MQVSIKLVGSYLRYLYFALIHILTLLYQFSRFQAYKFKQKSDALFLI